MNRAAYEATLGTAHRVCGRRLVPFSVAHWQAMEAMGLPFPYRPAGYMITPACLRVAIWHCSRTADQIESDFKAPAKWWMRWHGFRHAFLKNAFHRDLEAFAGYLADYTAAPLVYRRQQSGSGEPNVPPLMGLVESVCVSWKGAISEARARSMPLGLLLHYHEISLHRIPNAGNIFMTAEEADDDGNGNG